ncbi:MAG: hypothetical protein SPE19_01090, partial [Candidatus Faecousia sp.]|nr:hypothetical protein [Candidatus Faecousia sp.]
SSWKFSEHFRTNRGIATTSVRTGLAMTGNLETERQTPICLSAAEKGIGKSLQNLNTKLESLNTLFMRFLL